MFMSHDSLQGEALDAADPQLVVCALARQSRHIYKKVLGLRSGPGRRLAQGPAHVSVRVLPLVAAERKREGKRDKWRKKEKNESSDSHFNTLLEG